MFELAEIMNKQGKMRDWAKAVLLSEKDMTFQLSEEDKLISESVDKWAKEIGEGKRSYKELSAYLQKVIQPEVYDAPQELLRYFFVENSSVGEFDDWTIDVAPKNTLQAYESARNGNVQKSYIDFTKIAPTTKNLQVETELKMEDLRRGGFKTVARMTQFAIDEFRNSMFFFMMDTLDTAITAGAQTATDTTTVSETSMDKMVKYLRGNRTTGELVSLSNSDRAYEISKLPSAVNFYSNTMKDQLNQNGILATYNGTKIAELPSSRATGDGTKLINPARVYGIAGTIGEMAMKGQMRVLSSEDINNEVINLKFTGFSFTFAITYPEKVFKITIN